MAKNTEIIFSARDNGVENTMSRIRQSAKEMGRDLMQEARSNTTSQKDAVKYYEDQIRLIERRNRIETQSARLQAQNRRDAGMQAAGEDSSARQKAMSGYKEAIVNINKGSKEDQIQVDLLRELIETTKVTSRDEARAEDKRSSQQRSEAERFAASSSGGGGGARGVASGMGSVNRGITGAADTLSQESAGGAMGSMAGLLARRIPLIAAAYGLGKVFTGSWTAEAKQESQVRELSALSGMDNRRLREMRIGSSGGAFSDFMYGPADLNVSREEFRQTVAPQMARARGTTDNLLGSTGFAMRGLEIQKGMAVGPEIVQALAKMNRTVENSGTMQNQAQILYRRMDAEGAFGAKGMDMSRMQDIMQSMVELQGGMFMRHGEMSGTGMVVDLMGRFEALGGSYKDDQYKSSTIQSLDRGLSSGGSPEASAIKMGILRQINPDMDVFDLEGEMDKGVQSQGFLKGVLDFVRNTGGNMTSKKLLFNQLTGGQMRNADVRKMIESGEFDSVGLGNAYVMGGSRDFDFRERATRGGSSSMAAQTMRVENAWEDFKGDFHDGLDSLGDRVVDAVTNLGDIIENLF